MDPMSGMIPQPPRSTDVVPHGYRPVYHEDGSVSLERVIGVEQALTWAEQVAELQVENAELLTKMARLEKSSRVLEGLIAELKQAVVKWKSAWSLADDAARESAQMNGCVATPAPAPLHDVSRETFPLNAIRHSR
jgi:hypothetical protein